MKKVAVILSILMIFAAALIPSGAAFANSALMEKRSGDNFGLFAVSDDDLSVISEELIFDFRAPYPSRESGPVGQVTAKYNINNAGGKKSALMGFPLMTSLREISSMRNPCVTCNGSAISYDIFYLPDPAIDISELSFEDVLELINNRFMGFGGEKGIFYTIDPMILQKTKELEIEFMLPSASKILYGCYYMVGIADSGGSHSRIKMATGYHPDIGLPSIFVIGEDISDISIKAVDMQGNGFGDGILSELVREEMAIDLYISSYAQSELDGDNAIDYDEARILTIGAIKNFIDGDERILDMSYLGISLFDSARLILLSYTAELEEGQNEVIITYPIINGGFNNHYRPSKYTYSYISSPAKNWKSFGSLTVRIYPSADAPFVIDSSLNMQRQEDGSYVCTISGVPDNNITIVLCASENPRYVRSPNFSPLIIIIMISIFLVIAAFVAGIGYLIARSIKRKKGNVAVQKKKQRV
ncbi:MAG: hypothetical protein GX095_01510 [Clostridiales bacterium]|nr:hypothetical protein [Clostridiales bacterium]